MCATVLAIVSTTTNAELFDRGGGLIYDSDQDLTWLVNANYAALELSDMRVAEVISEVGSVAGHTLIPSDFYKTPIGIYTGAMKWWGAMAWAETLVYGGFDDWRLPTTMQFDDPSCSGDIRSAGQYKLFYEHRAGCTGGEMELLTYLHDPWNNPLFINVNRTRYWMATPYRDWMDPCIDPIYEVPCSINNDNGVRTNFYWQWGFTGFKDPGGEYDNVPFKTTLYGGNNRFAWAVRDGDVIASSLPGDINFDGQVNVADYLLLSQFVLETGLTPTAAELTAGDMNLNGQLDAGDLVIHSRTIMGLI